MQIRASGIILLMLFTISCAENKRMKNDYFDSRRFFESEIQRLQASKEGLRKSLVFGDKEQFIEVRDTVNWPLELRSFAEIDLAADAFTGLFSVDTVKHGEDMQVHYLSKDSKEEIKEITIVYKRSEIEKVTFILSGENSLYNNRKVLRYNRDSGYAISGEQQVNYLAKTTYLVGASWID